MDWGGGGVGREAHIGFSLTEAVEEAMPFTAALQGRRLLLLAVPPGLPLSLAGFDIRTAALEGLALAALPMAEPNSLRSAPGLLALAIKTLTKSRYGNSPTLSRKPEASAVICWELRCTPARSNARPSSATVSIPQPSRSAALHAPHTASAAPRL